MQGIRFQILANRTGFAGSVDRTGDSYDNVLAESVIGLYKTELISRYGPWRNFSDVEFATLKWVDSFNNRRLLSSIGSEPVLFDQPKGTMA